MAFSAKNCISLHKIELVSQTIGFVNQKLKTVFDVRELGDELLYQCLLFVVLLTISNVHDDITHIRLSLQLALSLPLIYSH